jgi:hypothetical protein
VLGAMSAVATVHAVVVVPSILHAAEIRAREIAQAEARAEAGTLREELRSRVVTADAQHANFVTHGELEQLLRELNAMQAQLTRIEERFSK